MNKNSLRGWKDIFSFTFVQTIKSKAFIFSTLFLMVLSLISMPLLQKVMASNEEEGAVSPIEKVYLLNETGFSEIDFSGGIKNTDLQKETFGQIVFEEIQQADVEAITTKIEGEENTAILLTFTEDESSYSLTFAKASAGPVKKSSVYALSDAITAYFDRFKVEALSITQEQLSLIEANTQTKVTTLDAKGAAAGEEDTSISYVEYWFIYGILFIVLMVNIMASTQVASAIVTEKSTRVVEYLLISVKPLALMVGKILAMLTVVITQVSFIIGILLISNQVSKALFGTGAQSPLKAYLPQNIFQNLGVIQIILCFVLIVLGFIFYAILAGLAGATVSRLEELGEGLTLFTMINLVGAYIGMGAAGVLMASGVNGFVLFAFLFPISAPFVLPGAILIGKANLMLGALAIVFQLLFSILLFAFAARVYETLILHRGNKIKIKELFKISKSV